MCRERIVGGRGKNSWSHSETTYRARRGKSEGNSRGVFRKAINSLGARGVKSKAGSGAPDFSARGDNNEVSVFRNDANHRSWIKESRPVASLSSFAISRPFSDTSSLHFHFPDGSLFIPRGPPFYDFVGTFPLPYHEQTPFHRCQTRRFRASYICQNLVSRFFFRFFHERDREKKGGIFIAEKAEG